MDKQGLTELIACTSFGNLDIVSKRYDFLVRICAFFTNILGFEKILDDYFNNLFTLPNITELFITSGMTENDFFEFKEQCEKVNVPFKEQLLSDKREIANYLKYNILIPYLYNMEPEPSAIYIDSFNTLFSEFGVTCTLDEIGCNDIGSQTFSNKKH